MYMFECYGQVINPFDSLQMTKLFSYPSPFQKARFVFWNQWESLFPLDAPYRPCFYWDEPPTLLLPERAQSLAEWSHCIFCGGPLESDVCNV